MLFNIILVYLAMFNQPTRMWARWIYDITLLHRIVSRDASPYHAVSRDISRNHVILHHTFALLYQITPVYDFKQHHQYFMTYCERVIVDHIVSYFIITMQLLLLQKKEKISWLRKTIKWFLSLPVNVCQFFSLTKHKFWHG